MPATGELIRLMNYVDDITTTLRRIQASMPTISQEERKRLADYMRQADPSPTSIMEQLESGK
jgi:hypothetical protein